MKRGMEPFLVLNRIISSKSVRLGIGWIKGCRIWSCRISQYNNNKQHICMLIAIS